MSKINLEVEIGEDTRDSMDYLCSKLGIDYEELIEFMVVFAKTSVSVGEEREKWLSKEE